jgi:hypothetical protein
MRVFIGRNNLDNTNRLVNREDHQLIKERLKYLEEVYQLSLHSFRRYWFNLRHLLIWADTVFIAHFGKISILNLDCLP